MKFKVIKMCINDACCERFWASLCKHLCTCIFVIVGIVTIFAGIGMMSYDDIDERYAYGTICGGVVCILLGGCVKWCCAEAIISKDGRVYQTF